MPSLKSRLIIFGVQNRHLLQGRLHREVVTQDTDILATRRQHEEGAKRFGALPEGIRVTPLSIPDLPPGLHAEWIYPAGAPDAPAAGQKAIFYTHGGGYISGSCLDHRNTIAKFAAACGVGALSYEYRLAPEHPFPAAVEDTLVVYRWLLAQGVNPADIVIAGESAGGGLCLAALLAIRDTGLALPAAGVALSPWTDLSCSGESYQTNARKDISTLGS